MIQSTVVLQAVVEHATEQGYVALDTEFISGSTYFAKLGLVQIGLSRKESHLVDVLAIDDLSPLAELLENPQVVKLLHDAQQDLLLLRRATGGYPRNVFDTQVAAGFIGLRSTISLSGLVRSLLNIKLGKGETRSDWLRRPLSKSQRAYAEDDVRYLPEVYQRLLDQCEQRDRKTWCLDEMRRYDDAALYEEKDIRRVFEEVKGQGKVTGQARAILREVAAWREEEARAQDRPRMRMIPDDVLIDLAQKQPRSVRDIQPRKGLNGHTIKRVGAALLQAVERGQAIPQSQWPRLPVKVPNDERLNIQTDFALAFIKGRGKQEGIDPGLIATRADVKACVRARGTRSLAEARLMQGWRAAFVGNDLVRILGGEGAVRINAETGLPEHVK